MKYVIVYFSCSRDFELLKVSLLSLKNINSSNQVVIVQDNEKKFSKKQADELIEIYDNLVILDHLLQKSSNNGNGKENILAQLILFKNICENYDADYLVKVDSDIYFNNDNFFKSLDGDLTGTKVKYKNESEYMYGCLYGLSNKAIEKLYKLVKEKKINNILDLLNEDTKKYYAENRVVYNLINYLKLKKNLKNHFEGDIFNLDILSNFRIGKAYNEKILSIQDKENYAKYSAIHMWSDIKLYNNIKKRKNTFYLSYKNIKVITVYILSKIYRKVKK